MASQLRGQSLDRMIYERHDALFKEGTMTADASFKEATMTGGMICERHDAFASEATEATMPANDSFEEGTMTAGAHADWAMTTGAQANWAIG